MRIVHIDTGQDLRGGQRQLLLLAEGLRGRGHDQLIACAEGSGLEERARAAGFPTFALPGHDPGHAFGALLLRQHLAGDHLDMIHAHDGQGQTIAWMASGPALPGRRVRRVASRRVTFLPGGLSSRLALHRLKYGRTCDGLIAISNYVKELLVHSGISEARIEVIPDGIEIPEALPGAAVRSRVRADWGFGERHFLIGHVGAFTPEKGQDLAIEAMLVLKDRFPSARLLLAGPGPEPASRAGRRVARLLDRAGDRVQMLGPLDDLAPFFAGLDLYVMPSRAEGLGSSALLAMAHGLAVVASRVGGLPEVVEERKTGWLVSADSTGAVSPAALAEAIALAASDRTRLTERGLQGRERARQFASDIMISRTEALYQRLVATAARARQ